MKIVCDFIDDFNQFWFWRRKFVGKLFCLFGAQFAMKAQLPSGHQSLRQFPKEFSSIFENKILFFAKSFHST